MRKWIVRLIAVCALGAMVALGAGFLGRFHPALDTFAHIRLHISACLLFAGLVLLFTRMKRISVLSLGAGALGIFASLQAFTLSATVKEPIAAKPVYTLYHINLLWNHKNPSQIINDIMARDPDLLSISEASQNWLPFLDTLEIKWPHLFSCPENGPRGGVRIYSKWPMDKSNDYCGTFGSFGKTTVTEPGGTKLDIASVHFRWPWPASGPRQLRSALPAVRAFGLDALVAGDFNATPWSHALEQFATTGNLEIVPGIGPTWLFTEFPAAMIGLIGFPIDNVAYKGRIRLLSAESLLSVGSDHLPVLVKFQID